MIMPSKLKQLAQVVQHSVFSSWNHSYRYLCGSNDPGFHKYLSTCMRDSEVLIEFRGSINN